MSDGRPNALPGSGPEQNNDSGNSNFESSARDAASGVDHYQSDVRSEAGRLSALEADAATTISSLASSNSNYPASNRFSPVLPLSSMREDTNSLLAASQLLSGPPNSSREAANRYHAPAGYAFHPSPPALAAPLPYAYDSAPGQLNARRTSYESQMSIDERGNSSSGSQETALGLMQLHQLPQLPSGPAKQIKRPNKLTPSAKAKGKGKARKSLDDDPDELESDFEGKKLAKGKARKPAGEKKKTSRACGACQKAHLTCDDGQSRSSCVNGAFSDFAFSATARPCARCVKKGCPDQCQDGARKKAKYLQEIPDECAFSIVLSLCAPELIRIATVLERRPSIPTPLPIPILPAIQPAGMSLSRRDTRSQDLTNVVIFPDSALPPPSMLPPPVDNPAPSFSFDTMPFYDSNAFANEFGSEAANLEYAILSSMLNGNGFAVNGNDQYGVGGPTEFNAAENDGSMLMHSPGGRNLIDSNGRSEGSATADTNNHAAGSVASTSRGGYTNSIFDRATLRSPPPASYGQVVSPPRLQDAASADLFQAVSAGLKSSSTPFAPQNGQTIDPTTSTPLEAPSAYPGRTAQSVQPLTSEEAYRTVTKPYPYAQSYHYLVQHLKERSVVLLRSRGVNLTTRRLQIREERHSANHSRAGDFPTKFDRSADATIGGG